MLPEFNYKFDKGPLDEAALSGPIEEGNCRLAVQLYFYRVNNLFIKPEDILCPRSYKVTGKFILREGEFNQDFTSKIKSGDIIFAQRIKNKDGSASLKSKENFKDEDVWLTALHTAIYLGDNKIWHATAIEGKSSYWTMSKFLEFYQPVAIKDFLN